MACALTAWMARHMRVMCASSGLAARRGGDGPERVARATVKSQACRWWPRMRVLDRVPRGAMGHRLGRASVVLGSRRGCLRAPGDVASVEVGVAQVRLLVLPVS